MPGSDLSKHLQGVSPDEYARWLSKKKGGDATANGYAANDIWEKLRDTDALQDEFGGEALDDLMDFIQERAGMKNDRAKPEVSPQDAFMRTMQSFSVMRAP